MARTLRDPKIDSRSARLKLAAQAEPYWRKITKGCYLGYRKAKEGGTWIARFRDLTGKQQYKALGAADDVMDADGCAAVNFEQAQEKAREWFHAMATVGTGERKRGAYRVENCMTDYLAWVQNHRKSHRHLETYIKAYIVPRLGNVDTAKLTASMIRKWHAEIAAEPPRLRTRKGKEQKHRDEDPNPAEATRKRKLRANRHLVTLRAALNRAWRDGHIARNDAWARVQLFPGTERARTRFLTHEQATRLINTCEPDLRNLVKLALFTGARYGELCAFVVSDFNPDSSTLYVRDPKNSKPRHIILNTEGAKFCTLLVAGRAPEEPLLMNAGGTRWERDHQHRPFKAAISRAKLEANFTFHELRHTWASLTIMAGAPLMVVAQNLGHRDTRMVERHYGHLENSFVAEMIRKTAPSFEAEAETNVVPMAAG